LLPFRCVEEVDDGVGPGGGIVGVEEQAVAFDDFGD